MSESAFRLLVCAVFVVGLLLGILGFVDSNGSRYLPSAAILIGSSLISFSILRVPRK
jgi:hypothetical protein